MLPPIWKEPAANGWMKKSILELLMEPPLRLLFKYVVAALPMPVRMKATWDAVARPWYLVGVFSGAQLAFQIGVPEISVVEFGVASGKGLLTLQEYAKAVEEEVGVKISVFGFDSGKGLVDHCGDYRDHPDRWIPGDFPIDEEWLRHRLTDRTHLIIGPVADTVPKFVREIQTSPIAFVAFDLDLYSSTLDALKILTIPGKNMLKRVAMYFDDITLECNHRFAGELLAIEEFNKANSNVKIDRWRGIGHSRPFPDSTWIRMMYIGHDLDAINASSVNRSPERL
jgi:hypothetical protein